MQTQEKKLKVAVVVKGYCKAEENKVLAIYLTDVNKCLMISNDGKIFTEAQAFDLLGDIINKYKQENYIIKYDLEKEEFDVTSFHPVIKVNNF